MTTQPRVLRGQFPQSQSQPIPQRFGNPQQHQFSPNPAFSPRHTVPPSSSPLHQQQFYQTATHEMYKGPGVSSTPPMMGMPPQQYYVNGGQRPRGPGNMPIRNNQLYYNPQMMSRGYQNVPPPGPSQQYYHQPPQTLQQYPMMQTPHATMQQPGPMYTHTQPGFPAQYTQGPPQGQHPSPMSQVPLPNQMMQQPPPPMAQGSGKRERRIIKIVDPSTNQDITNDIMNTRQDSTSTPPSGRSSVTGTPPITGDVAAKFAAQVALAAGTKTNFGGAVEMPSAPVGNHIFQQEQLVGSPNLAGPTHVPPYVPAASPRPTIMQPGHFMPETVNQMLPQGRATHMTMPQQRPVQQPYQLPNEQQQFTSQTPQAIPQNIPENAHAYTPHAPTVLTPGLVQIAKPPTPHAAPEQPAVEASVGHTPEQPSVTLETVDKGPVIPVPDIAKVPEIASKAAEAPAVKTSVVSKADSVSAGDDPVETVVATPKPKDSKQAPETEDTAIRLECEKPEPPVVNEKKSEPGRVAEIVNDADQADVDSGPAPETKAEDLTPIPSAKTVPAVEKIELKNTEPVLDKETSVAPPKADPPVVEKPKPNGDVSVPADAAKPSETKTVPAEQKSPERVAVNGVSPDTSIESEPPKNPVQDPAPLPKISESETNGKARDASRPSENSVADKASDKSNGDSSTKSGKQIKYPDDDKWSPANQQGKRQYDSNFLLQFQYRPSSLSKPKDLPNIDCVLEQPHKQKTGPMPPMEIRGTHDFTPSYMPHARTPRNQKYGRQNSRDQRYIRPPAKKIVSIDRDVELKTTANAWKPIKRDVNSKLSQEELDTLGIMRDVRVILNKVTPSTFKDLMQQVLALKIDTEKKLRGTIDLIFEKAIDEPNFSEAYANMCRQMTQIRVTPEESPDQQGPAGPVEFRKLILTKCQKEFERDKSDREHLLELKKKMEANTDQELAPQLKEEYDTAEFKDRRRTLGNIRFIGELFKLRMLTEPIMHNCIMTLFKAKDDDHLESLCRLLTTIGKDLDHPKAKERLDQYFSQIRKIIDEKRTSSRVRFMLQDVNDLRANNWVPRAIQTQGPKTISQIHQDAKNEQEMLQLKLASAPNPIQKQGGGRNQNRMGNRVGGEDGWTKVQTAKPVLFDRSKMKIQRTTLDENKVTLGPSKGYAGWRSGSAGSSLTKTGSSGYSPSGSMDRTPEGGARSSTPSTVNRFSALQSAEERRQGGRPGSRDGSRSGSRGSMGPPSSNPGRTPRRDERSSLLEAARKITSADRSQDSRQRRSRESSPSIPKPRPATPQHAETAHKYNTDLDEEKMQQKSRNILEEFLSIVDFKEATECIEELNAPPTLMHALVYAAHEFTLEKKREQRVNIGRLMAHLLKRGRLSVDQYIKGLAELLELGSDFEIDVPKVWEYFADQMAPVFAEENEAEISLAVLGKLAAPLAEEDRSGVFVAEIVKAIIGRGNLDSFVARWQRSNLDWCKILNKGESDVSSFLEKHNLRELGGQPQGQSASAPEARQNEPSKRYRLEMDLTQLLNKGLSNDDIFDWVEKNLTPEEAVAPDFIRALTISVCRRSLKIDAKDGDKMTVVEDKITERSILLNKYIENRQDRELQVLYALQNLMVELDQPRDVLRMLFDVFYNEDVVQEQTFYNWEKSEDPNEQEGRGVTVASVNMFFTWLRTADPESDGD